MQNHLLNYHNQFHLTFIFQSTVKTIHLIFVETM